MHKVIRHWTAFFLLTFVATLGAANATGIPLALPSPDTSELDGDPGLACAAILCLAGSKPPHECDPALSRFFDIKKRKLSDTLDARKDFLNLCPSATESSPMQRLVDAMARGAGRCDAATLNATLRYDLGPGGDYGTTESAIADGMPSYCAVYILHEYVRITDELPRYVGKPEEDGFWVEANRYEAALARYQREQAAKKASRENYGGGGN